MIHSNPQTHTNTLAQHIHKHPRGMVWCVKMPANDVVECQRGCSRSTDACLMFILI